MSKKQPKDSAPNAYPPWAPRFWNAMCLPDYIKLHAENRFRIHPTRWPLAFMAGGCSIFNSMLAGIQSALYGKRIRETKIEQPPIFIIGHWRSGTTLMHELLSLDQQLAFPSTFDTFVPRHLLVSRFLVYPLIHMLLPRKRPMDNMQIGAASPQEDDFAICGLGAPTPYRRMAYPNRQGQDLIQLNSTRATPEQQQKLHQALEYFYKTLTLHYKKPLVLKSPPHTGRIRLLAKWFPGAKFIHLSRHPYRLVPSTMHLWRSLDRAQGFQIPRYDDAWLKNYVFECQDLMYQAYSEQAKELADNQLVEVQFEELIQSPEAQIRRVYEQLELDGVEELLPQITQSFANRKNHSQNRLTLDPHLKIEIDQHWRGYMEQFGYLEKSKRSTA